MERMRAKAKAARELAAAKLKASRDGLQKARAMKWGGRGGIWNKATDWLIPAEAGAAGAAGGEGGGGAGAASPTGARAPVRGVAAVDGGGDGGRDGDK